MVAKSKGVFLLIGIFLFIVLLNQTSSFLGTYQQDTCVSVRGKIDATSSNVSIYYPNSSIVISNQEMDLLNGQIFNYTFCNTSTLGTYVYDYCDENGDNCVVNSFEITKTGQPDIGSGQGNILIIALVVIFLSAIGFFVLGFKSKNMVFAIIFFTLAGAFIFITALFSMVLIDNLLADYSNVVEGYSTFIMVLKILFGIGILALIIYAGMISLKLWKIKRGFSDE